MDEPQWTIEQDEQGEPELVFRIGDRTFVRAPLSEDTLAILAASLRAV
jgi:hypothetical protein